jgi:hypothetical protein
MQFNQIKEAGKERAEKKASINISQVFIQLFLIGKILQPGESLNNDEATDEDGEGVIIESCDGVKRNCCLFKQHKNWKKFFPLLVKWFYLELTQRLCASPTTVSYLDWAIWLSYENIQRKAVKNLMWHSFGSRASDRDEGFQCQMRIGDGKAKNHIRMQLCESIRDVG